MKIKGDYMKFKEEKQDIYEFLDLVNALFYQLINNVFLEYLEGHKSPTNYDNLKKKFKISPAKILAAP